MRYFIFHDSSLYDKMMRLKPICDSLIEGGEFLSFCQYKVQMDLLQGQGKKGIVFCNFVTFSATL